MFKSNKFCTAKILITVFLLVSYNDASLGSVTFHGPNFSPIVPTKFEVQISPGEIGRFYKHVIRAFLDTKFHDTARRLTPKWFDGRLIYFGEDGHLKSSKAEFRVTGDTSDHILFDEAWNLVTSLQIKLKQDNIGGITKFKLLLPRTRNGDNEVFVSAFLESAGVVSPFTKMVDVNIFGYNYRMIFQEKIGKQLIERWGFREGPLLEGDERQYYEGLMSRAGLSWGFFRMENRPYNDSQVGVRVGLLALTHLNRYRNSLIENNPSGRFPSTNRFAYEDIYTDLLYLLNAHHGLNWHNRKMYFDAIRDQFVPIYYDGNALPFDRSENIFKLVPTRRTKIYFEKYPINALQVLSKYRQRGGIQPASVIKEFMLDTESFFSKDEVIRRQAKEPDGLVEYRPLNDVTDLPDAIAFPNDLNLGSFTECIFLGDNFPEDGILGFSGERVFNRICRPIDWEKFQRIVQGQVFYTIKGNGTKIYVKTPGLLDEGVNYSLNYAREESIVRNVEISRYSPQKLKFAVSAGEILVLSFTTEVPGYRLMFEVENNESNSGRVLIVGKIPDEISIDIRSYDSINYSQEPLGFNRMLLSGCLTFVDSTFHALEITTNYLRCEDAVNFVRSKGIVTSLTAENSHGDGIDIDSSDITLQKIRVSRAGNDCVDLSMGDYLMSTAHLENCKDKGISLGERGIANFDDVLVSGADIAVASKDSSTLSVNKLIVEDARICLAAYRKKQEFGPGQVSINELGAGCSKLQITDSQSSVVIH